MHRAPEFSRSLPDGTVLPCNPRSHSFLDLALYSCHAGTYGQSNCSYFFLILSIRSFDHSGSHPSPRSSLTRITFKSVRGGFFSMITVMLQALSGMLQSTHFPAFAQGTGTPLLLVRVGVMVFLILWMAASTFFTSLFRPITTMDKRAPNMIPA